jgi:hypothetical protein
MLLWCDGWDHYGVLGNLTEGAWAEVNGAGWTLSTSNPRTGTYSMAWPATASFLRRVLGGAKTTVGVGAAFYYTALPGTARRARLFDFRDASNTIQVSIGTDTTGTISAYRGSIDAGTLLGVTASPVITAEAYQHVECIVFFSQTVGTVEVRVNGVTVLSLTGVDTVASALVESSQVGIGGAAGSGGSTGFIDDVFCYDGTGSFNNSFLGDRRVITLFPTADTIQADWTPVGSATGFGAIDEASPDGDTTYISAGLPGSPTPTSEFGMDNLPAGISAISGVVLVNMSRKTEAGVANVQMSVISGASETAGTDTPMTEIYTYRQDVFEIDPASAAPFTVSEVDALLIKADRTA